MFRPAFASPPILVYMYKSEVKTEITLYSAGINQYAGERPPVILNRQHAYHMCKGDMGM